MKKIKRFFNITALALGVAFVLQGKGNSGAWFMTSVVLDQEITASTKGAYYEKGKGTKDDPYCIKSAYHLYNLAWLQYLGYYDDQPYYFKLSENLTGNLDMSGYTLPPIGTVNHPFISFFDGNGKTITNATFSNNYTDFNRHPFTVTESSFNDGSTKTTVKTSRNPTAGKVEIVGMFGVVGPYSGENTYESATRQIDDYKLDGVKIRAVTDNALVGALAGYVNSEIQNVAVNNIDIKVGTNSKAITTLNGEANSNISNYSTIGYCTEKYRSSRYENVTNVYDPYQADPIQFNAEESGQSAGWGGSIDMKTMYDNLDAMYSKAVRGNKPQNNSYAVKYPTTEQIVKDYDDNVLSDDFGSYQIYSSGGSHYMYNFSSKNDEGKQTSSVSLNVRTDTNAFQYLSGYYETEISNALSVTTNDWKDISTKYISDTYNNRTYYLSATTGGITNNVQDKNNATQWIIENGKVFFQVINKTSNTETKYYLNGNVSGSTGSLSIGTNANDATTWSQASDGNLTMTRGSYVFFLNYTNNGWTLTRGNLSYYLISDGNGHYLNSSISSIYSGTSASSATHWSIDNNNKIYLTDNTSYYLSFYRSVDWDWDSWSYTFEPSIRRSANDGNDYYYAQKNGNSIYRRISNYSYYYAFSNGSWTASQTNTALSFEGKSTDSYPVTIENGPTSKTKQTTSSTKNSPVTVPDTYFPLKQDSDGNPLNNNTGYVIGGYNSDQGSDIRVSAYPVSDLNNSGNASLSTVYTIKDGTNSTITDTSEYFKYDASYEKMKGVLSEENNVYGLHFLDATIGKTYTQFPDHEVRAESATVNGVTTDNYQLPTDAIDFNLASKGYINFFAGTYYPHNNSFFSLYQIVRNANKTDLEDIRHIRYIYSDNSGNNHSYVYEYDDGSYSVPYKIRVVDGERVKFALDDLDTSTVSTYVENSTTTTKPSGFNTRVFNYTDIENPDVTDYAAYYFEIPVNDGEYALGSVPGRNGAYLMYLDIGANANTVYRTTVYEKIMEVNSYFDYPNGVALTTETPTNNGTQVKAEDSICAVITGGSGTDDTSPGFTFSRSDNTITISGVSNYGTTGGKSYLTYVGASLDTGTLKAHARRTDTKTTERMTYFDFYSATDENSKTVISTVKYDSTDSSVTKDDEKTITTYLYDSASGTYTESDDVTIYSDHDSSDATTLVKGRPVETDAAKEALYDIAYAGYDTNGDDKIILTFNYLTDDGNEVTQTYLLNAAPTLASDGTNTITLNGYTITVEHKNGGTVVLVNVTKKDTSMTITINGQTIVAAGNPTDIPSTEGDAGNNG